MSQDTSLDDAIAKAREAEDWQLVEWLRMARGSESASRWYTERLQQVQAENEWLQKELDRLERSAFKAQFPDVAPWGHCYRSPNQMGRGTKSLKQENAELRELARGFIVILDGVAKDMGHPPLLEMARTAMHLRMGTMGLEVGHWE